LKFIFVCMFNFYFIASQKFHIVTQPVLFLFSVMGCVMVLIVLLYSVICKVLKIAVCWSLKACVLIEIYWCLVILCPLNISKWLPHYMVSHPSRQCDCHYHGNLKSLYRVLCYIALTLSVRAEYIYSAASQATSPDGVYILRDFHKVVKWPSTVDFKF
jgi:hypothetical protein